MNLLNKSAATSINLCKIKTPHLACSKEFRKTFVIVKNPARCKIIELELTFIEGFSEYNYTYNIYYRLISKSESLKLLQPFTALLFDFDGSDCIVFLHT